MPRAPRRRNPVDGEQELLAVLIGASPCGILLVEADGAIALVNPQLERIVGYTRAELIGRPLELLLPDRSRSAHGEHFEQFATAPHPRHMGAGRELFARHRDGRDVPVEIGLAPVRYADRDFVLATIVDVSTRREAEQRLRWLSLAVEQGPTSIVMTDLAGKIEYVNAKFTEVTGYTLDEVRGKNPRILKSGDTAESVYQELWTAITAGRTWHGEIRNRRKDGTTYWDAMWVYPLRDDAGHITRFLALKEDVSARRLAEEALAAREAYHRTLLANIGDAVFVVDHDGRYVDANPGACELTGYSREELLRMRVPDLYPEELRAQAERRVADVAAGRPTIVERPLVTKSGKVITVEANARPLERERIVATVRDISDRRQLEAQFRQAQKMEAVGRLAGGVAHDFNNVLTAIFGYADLLTESLPPDHAGREDLREIRTAATRASALTRQLLAFSRQQVLQPVVLNLNEIVQTIEKMLYRLLGEDVDLVTSLAAGLGNVRADPGQLEQVLVNLAVNARDAMPTGGKLTIETSNVELDAEYAETHPPVVPGHFVMLAVSDTGIGMDEATKGRVFEPFFTTKAPGKGTGLGLATVYGIVKQSGGFVWLYSEPGRGASFKIYLPRVEAPIDSPAPPPELAGTVAGTETVLVAEDDPLLLPLARELLSKLGYTVLEARDSAEALALARAHQGEIHLLVSDVVMPGGGGFALAQQLRAERPSIRVLFMSGYTDEAVVRHGLLERGTNFLQKPFTPAVLARRVREVLNAK